MTRTALMVGKICGWATTLVFVASFSLPSLIVLDFTLERERIEREVCQMRNASPGANTCHGNCYLMRHLRAAEGRERHPFEQLEIRVEPAVISSMRPPTIAFAPFHLPFAFVTSGTLAGSERLP